MEIGGKETHGIETKKAMEKQNKILIIVIMWHEFLLLQHFLF